MVTIWAFTAFGLSSFVVGFVGGWLFHEWERRRWARRIVRKLEREG